jgi:curved DNA-binding protein
MSTRSRDFYEVLGVARDASQEDIRRAYRRLARKHHPDVSSEEGADARFKEISEAYDTLSDPAKRADYDNPVSSWQAGPPGGRRAGRDGFRDVRVDFGDGAEGVEDLFGDGGMGGIFGDLFGRRGSRGFGSGDQEVAVELTLEEAARGGPVRIELADGRTVEAQIPAGVAEGQRLRLEGQGTGSGDARGDLVLRVRLRPHSRFRVEGRDLHTEVDVAPADAALGGTVEVPTLSRRARTKVPAGSSCGRRLRLRGKGLPNPGGAPGDLYATIRIVVPKHLSAEEREAYERLREAGRTESRAGAT